MRKLLGRAAQSLNKAAQKGVDQAKRAAKDPEIRDRVVTTVTNTLSAEKARKIAEATLGKETTEKVARTCGEAYNRADKACGEGRLDGAFKSARSAVLSVPVAGKALPWAVFGAAVAGYATKRDVVGDAANAIFGTDKKKADETTDKTVTDKTADSIELPPSPAKPKKNRGANPQPR